MFLKCLNKIKTFFTFRGINGPTASSSAKALVLAHVTRGSISLYLWPSPKLAHLTFILRFKDVLWTLKIKLKIEKKSRTSVI